MRTTLSSLASLPWRAVFYCSLLLGLLGSVARPAAAQAPPPDGPVTYQTFYDSLSPYGQWVSDPDYGYAWVPTAGPDFQPYRTSGHWVYTDYGWTWVSDYKWGWAAFHYGRWRYSDAYGWLWVPGYTWGPAWVAWRQSAGYYGWAPLGPPPVRSGVHVSIGFSFSFGDAPVAPARWCFVPAAYVASPAIATYYVPPTQTTVVYNNTTIIHNTYVNNTITNVNNTTVVNNQGRQRGGAPGAGQPAFPAGPARADVEKATGQPITPLAIANRATPGVGVQGKALAFYRPTVAAPNLAGQRGPNLTGPAPAPQQVVPVQEAASRARRSQPTGQGLVRDNAAQHLSSTDPNPIQAAQIRQRAANPNTPSPAPSSPAGQHDRSRNQANAGFSQPGQSAPGSPAATQPVPNRPNRAQPTNGQPGRPTSALSNAGGNQPQPQQPGADQAQAKAQRDQAHQQQQAQRQQQNQAQREQQEQARQQQQQARQQQNQARQQQQAQRQQQQQAQRQQQQQVQRQQQQQAQRQQQQAQRQQDRQRAPHPEEGERRR